MDEKLTDSQSWIEAQKTLDNFEEMMKLVRQYPVKPMIRAPPSPPYTTPDLYKGLYK